MADSSNHVGGSGVIEFTGKIMVVAIILLFFAVVFVFCLNLYAKWFWYRRQEATMATTTTRRRRRRLDFAAGYHEITVVSQGLDPSVLKTIPVKLFDPQEFKEGLECAVCLCDVSQGEKTRLLPKCNHGFHVDCIDMWFQSHSTCPLCRNPVSNSEEPTPATGAMLQGEGSSETANFPTNVLFWGDETRVSTFCVEGEDHESSSSNGGGNVVEQSNGSTSSRSDEVSVIDIQRQMVTEEEEHEKNPVPTRLRSLKRLLSGNRRVSPSSPSNFDIEQGPRSLN